MILEKEVKQGTGNAPMNKRRRLWFVEKSKII